MMQGALGPLNLPFLLEINCIGKDSEKKLANSTFLDVWPVWLLVLQIETSQQTLGDATFHNAWRGETSGSGAKADRDVGPAVAADKQHICEIMDLNLIMRCPSAHFRPHLQETAFLAISEQAPNNDSDSADMNTVLPTHCKRWMEAKNLAKVPGWLCIS